MKKLAFIAVIFIVLALLWVQVALAEPDAWTQTLTADFAAGTAAGVTTANNEVKIANLVLEPGFETVTSWTYAEVDTNATLSGAQSTDTITGWPTEGSNSYKFTNTGAIALNDYCEVQQSVDLTYIDTLYFDWRLICGPGGAYTANAFVDGTAVGTGVAVDKNDTVHTDQSADVSTYSDSRTVSFRITSNAVQSKTFTCYVDNITMTSSSTNLTTLTSSNNNCTFTADLTTITWNMTEPTGTNVKFQLRSADVEAELTSAGWYGPTTTGDYYETSGTSINSEHDGDGWIQYKLFLDMTDAASTPILSDVTINYLQEWGSYKDSGHNTVCNNFNEGAEDTVYMYGVGYTSGNYKVAYYEYDTDGGGVADEAYKVETDTFTGVTVISSECYFPTYAGSVDAGTWHAIVCDAANTPPSIYDPGWGSTLNDDEFEVQAVAIPEFPTIFAAIGVAGLCFGIYYWMRKRRLAYVKG